MKRERIVIIEDEIDLLSLLDFNLTRRGYATHGILDGSAAMRKIEETDPDLVILDLMLPGVDGWEICSRIKGRDSELPVLMLTAKSMPEDKVKGLEAGADDYMTKPFEVKELLIRVENLLKKRRGREINRILVHEVANRMVAIQGYSELMERDKGVNAPIYLGRIKEQAGYTAELLSEISTIMGHDAQADELESVDMAGTAREISAQLEGEASRRGIAMDVDAQEGCELKTYRFAVRQIIVNLLGNAIKYGRENGRVSVTVRNAPEGVAVKVSDDGLGIPAKELPFIFEKGYRATNAGGAKGSGFGLHIVKKLATETGSRVEARSIEGEGSEFTVIFRPLSGRAS